VYACRVGTSICDSRWRASSIADAQASDGMSGTRIRSRLEGRCVKTIVFRSPMRLATRDAARNEMADRTLVPKNRGPSVAASAPKRSWNQ
jgi:hypothetical protein